MTELEGREAFERFEHAGQAASHGGFAKRAAVLVAILAALLAIATLLSNRASQQTILRQAEASDAYNEFEANSLKAHIDGGEARILRVLSKGTPNEAAAVAQAIALNQGVYSKYNPTKDRLLARAHDLESQRDSEETRHRNLQISEGVLEIAIVLTSVAILTGMLILVWTSAGLGLIGLAILALAFLAT